MPVRLYDDDHDVHLSSFPWASNLWKKTRGSRLAMISQQRDVFPVATYVLAAVEIQRFWRGVLLRRRVLEKYLEHNYSRRWKQEEAAMISRYRATPRASESLLMPLLKRVQARWRTVMVQQEFARWTMYDRWPIYYVAATTIQRAWVDFQFAKHHRRHKHRSKRFFLTKEDAAAGRVQNAWKAYLNKQVFAFYVELIRYREKGDPMLMLKCIDLGEAAMMDPAAGLHVRFRLGGATFPPAIYYKVFTHNNVADIGAFAPKDYTRARKKPTPAQLHNSTGPNLQARARDRTGWYQRVDNNDWKPIADRVMRDAESIVEDREAVKKRKPFTEDSPFHYSKLKRAENKELVRKQKRREWLSKLYASEQAQHSDAPKAEVYRDAKMIFDGMSEHEVDEEVGKLLQWTSSLDYDSYRTSWLNTATTAPTDALIGLSTNSPSKAVAAVSTFRSTRK